MLQLGYNPKKNYEKLKDNSTSFKRQRSLNVSRLVECDTLSIKNIYIYIIYSIDIFMIFLRIISIIWALEVSLASVRSGDTSCCRSLPVLSPPSSHKTQILAECFSTPQRHTFHVVRLLEYECIRRQVCIKKCEDCRLPVTTFTHVLSSSQLQPSLDQGLIVL